MSCNCKGKPRYVEPGCMEPTPWGETSYLVGLDQCGKIIKTDKPEYELTELDREKLDRIDIDGGGIKALYDDGTYKDTYTTSQVYNKQETDTNIARAIDELNDHVSGNYLSLSGNTEQTPVTGDVYTAGRIIARQTGPEGTQFRVMVDGTESGIEHFGSTASHTNIRTSGRITVNSDEYVAYMSDIGTVVEDVAELEIRVTEAEDAIHANTTSISDLQTATEAGFDTVNNELSSLGDRVTTAETGIEINSTDIENLRDDIANLEKFRGYYATTDEVTAISNPTNGDYAWNAETGTVWSYNGTTWYNTTVPIPDQTVIASETTPAVPSGPGYVGISNRYMRADAVIPSDPAKADLAVLNDYLPLAGNTQTSRMTGPVWMSTGQRVNLTNSGNSYLGQDADTNTTRLVGNGVGGVDLVSANGTVKANGQRIVTYETNGDINAPANIVLGNDNKVLGTDANSSTHNLIELSRFGIIDAGSSTVPFNITTSIRPTVQLAGESGAEAHGIAFVNDLESARTELQSAIEANTASIEINTGNIAGNTSDIESILSRLANEENFRGYKLTTNDVTSIINPQNGNYAYNVQTGTIWIYNGVTWADSGEAIPDGAIQAYDGVPLEDGDGNSGASNEYARGDHQHPSDSSKANVMDLISTNNTVSTLRGQFDNYVSSNDSEVDALRVAVATNTGNISSLTTRTGTAETNISNLQGQASQIGNQVNEISVGLTDAVGRIGTNELNIESLFSLVNENENFKGYYLTNAEITRLTGTSGDFAWSAESGTIWVYDASVPSWTDSGNPIPEEAVSFYNGDPLVNGEANPGEAVTVSRGDHVHPSDPTKADVTDIPTALSQLTNDPGYITASQAAGSYVPISQYNALADRVEALEVILSGVSGFWSGTQEQYDAIVTKDPNTYYHTYQ